MKVYLPATQRVEDFLSTLEDVTAPGAIKTRAVIEIETDDANVAKFLQALDVDGKASATPKARKNGRPKKSAEDFPAMALAA